jgi:hypothetical protein
MRHGWIVAVFAAAACADDANEVRWTELVRKLGDDAFAVREEAQAELVRAGEKARAFLASALEVAEDPEVRVRLKEILASLGRARWSNGLKAGLEEARRTGRPLLVVSADGPEEAAASGEGLALRTLLKDEKLFAALSDRFILVWWNAGAGQDLPPVDASAVPMPPEGHADPDGRIGFYFCTSRGTVRHFVPGWWKPATVVAEAERAAAMLEASDAGQALKCHAEALAAVREAAAALERDAPEAVKKEGTPEKARFDALKALAEAYGRGVEVLGEPVETYLGNRLKDLQARRHPR